MWRRSAGRFLCAFVPAAPRLGPCAAAEKVLLFFYRKNKTESALAKDWHSLWWRALSSVLLAFKLGFDQPGKHSLANAL